MTDFATWKEPLTLVMAAIGCFLGVMNTWNAMSQRRLRLRVSPVHVIPVGNGPLRFGIEIVNLSAFPVNTEEVGFFVKGKPKGRRVPITACFVTDGGQWPRRLETRSAVTVAFNPRDIISGRVRLDRAYVRTACGHYVKGTSGALDQLKKEIAL